MRAVAVTLLLEVKVQHCPEQKPEEGLEIVAVAVVWRDPVSAGYALQINGHEGCGPSTEMRYRACVAIGFSDEAADIPVDKQTVDLSVDPASRHGIALADVLMKYMTMTVDVKMRWIER